MTLFIDTHLNDVIIITFDGDKIITKKEIKSVRQNSTIIMPTIKEVLNGFMPSSIIAVNGPGSFTGVRLGVTIAKTFAFCLNIPIRVISSLECMAVCLNGDKKCVAFSDNNGYYVGCFDSNNRLLDDYKYINNDEYQELIKKEEIHEDINIDYETIIKFALSKKAINPHQANPVYIKKLDVEK